MPGLRPERYWRWFTLLQCIKFEADQVVAGLAINILMLGLPARDQRRDLRFDRFDAADRDQKIMMPMISNSLSWGSILAFLLVPICWYVLYKTPFGLRLRAVGENPEAADAAGVNVIRFRYIAVVISGVLAAAGGAYLSIRPIFAFYQADDRRTRFHRTCRPDPG